MTTTNWLVLIGAGVAVAGVTYYLHQAGFFTSLFKTANELIDKIKETKPLDEKSDKEAKLTRITLV